MTNVIRYKEIINIFIPLALSSILTAVLALIDSTMILNYDIIAVSAVNVSNQLNQLFVPIIFGVASGFALYIVQFYEEKNMQKVKRYFHLTLILVLLVGLIQFLIGFFFNEQIANFFFDPATKVNEYVADYTKILAFNAFFIAIEYAFIFQLRSSKRTKIIFISSIIKALCNIVFNFLLIYGNFGFPELGIKGAALATVIATFIGNVFLYYAAKQTNLAFVDKKINTAKVTKEELKGVFITVWPLIVVELLFGVSRVIQMKEFSLVSFEQFNIMQLANMSMLILNAFVMTSTTVASVVIGSVLVYKNSDLTNKTLHKINKFFIYLVVFVMFVSIIVFPLLYKLTPLNSEQFKMMFNILIANGFYISLRIFTSSHLAVLRSGGKTFITIFLDAGVSFVIAIPVLYITYLLTGNIVIMKYMLLLEGIVRIFLTFISLKKVKWQNKMI